MGCSNCSTSKDGKVKGARIMEVAEQIVAINCLCSIGWNNSDTTITSQIPMQRFKPKTVVKNTMLFTKKDLQLNMGDVVISPAKSGYDVGVVSLTGALVPVQMKRKDQRCRPTS